MYAPHALPMFREEQNSKKRKERSDRKDPVRSKKPDPPVSETAGRVIRLLLLQSAVVLVRCFGARTSGRYGLQGMHVVLNPAVVRLLQASARSFRSTWQG